MSNEDSLDREIQQYRAEAHVDDLKKQIDSLKANVKTAFDLECESQRTIASLRRQLDQARGALERIATWNHKTGLPNTPDMVRDIWRVAEAALKEWVKPPPHNETEESQRRMV